MARPNAFAPLEIDWWRRIGEMVWQSGRDLFNDNAPQWAAAVAYYSLLSTFPLLLAGASLLSFLVDPSWAVHQAVSVLGKLLPMGEHRIEEVVQNTIARRGTAGLVSTLVLLWSGTRIFGTLTQALNIAFDVDEVYGFWKRRLAELLMLLSVGVVFVLALLVPFVLPTVVMGAARFPRVNPNRPSKPPLGGFNLAVSSFSENRFVPSSVDGL